MRQLEAPALGGAPERVSRRQLGGPSPSWPSGATGPPACASPCASCYSPRSSGLCSAGLSWGQCGLWPRSLGGPSPGRRTWQRLFSPKRGLGSRSVPCSGSKGLTLQRAGRAPAVRDATRGTEGLGGAESCAEGPGEGVVMEEGRGPPRRSRQMGRARGGQAVGLPRGQRAGSGTRRGQGPQGPAAGGARGLCLGAGPSSIPPQPHARRAAVRCQIPAPASPDLGVGPRAPPPRPTFQAHLAAWPARIQCPPTPAPLGAPGTGEEMLGRDWGTQEWRPGRAGGGGVESGR